ncbi:MAG: hypothetical protein HY695_11320 [Deltaproteobacteria bacterium]|nr:hypothetical protein [Deltaproteobacteria bacterium]
MSCLSRFTFHAVPGKTGQLEKELIRLAQMVASVGGIKSRVLHTHFASSGAPDVVFEQEASDLADLEAEITKLTENPEFQLWTKKMSSLLTQSPKREIYIILDDHK